MVALLLMALLMLMLLLMENQQQKAIGWKAMKAAAKSAQRRNERAAVAVVHVRVVVQLRTRHVLTPVQPHANAEAHASTHADAEGIAVVVLEIKAKLQKGKTKGAEQRGHQERGAVALHVVVALTLDARTVVALHDQAQHRESQEQEQIAVVAVVVVVVVVKARVPLSLRCTPLWPVECRFSLATLTSAPHTENTNKRSTVRQTGERAIRSKKQRNTQIQQEKTPQHSHKGQRHQIDRCNNDSARADLGEEAVDFIHFRVCCCCDTRSTNSLCK